VTGLLRLSFSQSFPSIVLELELVLDSLKAIEVFILPRRTSFSPLLVSEKSGCRLVGDPIRHASAGRGKAHKFVDMLFIVLFVILAALLLATSSIRNHLPSGISARSRIAKGDVAMAKEGVEPSRLTNPLKRKLFVVVLPDGKVVSHGSREVFATRWV
jgi:hypothetical protein